MPERHPVFTLLGVRPIIVEDLGHPALLLPDEGIILLDTRADLDVVGDWALATAAQEMAAAGPEQP